MPWEESGAGGRARPETPSSCPRAVVLERLWWGWGGVASGSGRTQGSAEFGGPWGQPAPPEAKTQVPLDALGDLERGRHLDLSTVRLGCPPGKGPSTGSCGQAEAWLPDKWPWAPLHLAPEARPGLPRPGWGATGQAFRKLQGCAAPSQSVSEHFGTPNPQVGWHPVLPHLPTSPREPESQGWEQAGRSSGSGRPPGALSVEAHIRASLPAAGQPSILWVDVVSPACVLLPLTSSVTYVCRSLHRRVCSYSLGRIPGSELPGHVMTL